MVLLRATKKSIWFDRTHRSFRYRRAVSIGDEMGHDKSVLDFVFLFALASWMIPLRTLPADNAGGTLRQSCTPQPHTSFETLMREREKHGSPARHGQPSRHYWRTSKTLQYLRSPMIRFQISPFLYDPISNIVKQQLQSLPLRAGDEGTTIALQDYRCPVTRHSISYINLICLTHPRRWALQLLASDSAGETSLDLLDCLGTSRLIVVPGV